MDPATWWGNPFFSTLPDMQLLEKQFGVISNAALSTELKDELLVLKPHSFFVSDEERRQSLQVDGVMSESKNFKQAKTIFLEMVEIFFDRLIHVMNIVTTVDVKWQEFFFFRSWSSGVILSLQRIEFFHDIFVLWHHLYKQKKSITNQQKILKVPLCHSLINFFTLHFLNVDSTLIGVPVAPSFLQSITESSSSSSSSSSASSHASFVSTTYDFPILKCEFALQSLILQKSQSQFTSSFSTTKREKRSETILKSFKKPKKESIISSSSTENTKPISQYFAPGMQNPLVAGKSRFFPGQIVIVPIETPSGPMHVFGRISDYVVVEKISVYIDPSERDYERVDEASIIEIPREWVHRITDLGVIEKWVEDPLEKFKKELTQQITSKVFDFLGEKLGLPDISFLQKVDQTPNEVTIDEFYQLKALDELLDELKGRSRPVALINNIQTAHSRSMNSFEAQYTASSHTPNPAAVFFGTTLKQRLQAYRNFSVETQLYAVLAQFKKKCNEASAHLEEELQRVINGERKRELTKWWLELINSSCQSLLQSIGFYKDSLPVDYFSEPPKDLKIVRRNTVLLGEVLNPHRDKHAVKLMVNRLKDLIYTRIELFVRHGFIALSVKLDLPSHTTELAPIKEKVKELMENKTTDEGLLKKMDDLIKDMEYLQEMQEMEQLSSGPQASNRLVLSNVVPISGLIIGYFFRQENIFKTTLELWDKTYQKPKPTPAPTPAPVEAETKPEAESEPVSEETPETPVDQQVETKTETESPSEPSFKDGSDQNPPDSSSISSSSSSSSSDSRDPSPEPSSPSAEPAAAAAAPAKTTSDIMARFQLLKKQREAQRAQK